MAVDIEVARTLDQRADAFRFRYEVLVSELCRNTASADHKLRQICDNLDTTAHIFVARSGSEVVGTIRINFVRDGGIHDLEPVLGLPPGLIHDNASASVTSRAAVAAGNRNSTVFARLARALYRYALDQGIVTDWIVSRPDLTELYTRMGYHAVGIATSHPEVGRVQPLSLDLLNSEHLATVGSIFYPYLCDFIQKTPTRKHHQCLV